MDVFDTFDLQESFENEPPIGFETCRDDLEQKVPLAGDDVAGHDLGHLPDRTAKAIRIVLAVAFQMDRYEDRQIQPCQVPVNLRCIADDDALILENSDAPQTRRWRKPNPVSQIEVGDSPLGLQYRYDPTVNGVHRDAHFSNTRQITIGL